MFCKYCHDDAVNDQVACECCGGSGFEEFLPRNCELAKAGPIGQTCSGCNGTGYQLICATCEERQ